MLTLHRPCTKRKVALTNDSFEFAWIHDHGSMVLAVHSRSEFLGSVSAGNEVTLILEMMDFHVEQGGQILIWGHF